MCGLMKLQNWCYLNKLSIFVSKTDFMFMFNIISFLRINVIQFT